MQYRQAPPGNDNNPKNRNTSYYKSRVGKKPKKESSVFIEKAKKRQWTNYRLAMIVLAVMMMAFAGLIFLGSYLNSLVVPNGGEINGDSSNLAKFAPKDNPDITLFYEPDAPVIEPPQPVDIATIFYNFNGVYLDVRKLESLEHLQDFIDRIKLKGINAVNIDIKKEDGTVPYHLKNGKTDSVTGEENQINIKIEDIINTLHANELYVSGTIACFKDDLAGTLFVTYTLRNSSSNIKWEDPANNGSYWLNAYSEGARDYIKGIVTDSANLGFDEIILSWFFFPNVAKEKDILYEDDGRTKSAVIRDFVSEQRGVLDDIAPKMKLGLYIPLKYFLNNMPNETMGLNPQELEDKCNFFATSFAPADVPGGTKINGAAISNPTGKPYETAKALCEHFKDIINGPIHFRPSIQAFGGYGEDQILYQRQALYEYGVNVWQLVNYENFY